MDDMVFQNINKNAIYVLNTSYNTYGEFGRPNNAFGYPQTCSDEIFNNSRNCSLSRSLHKLKSLRHNSSELISGGASNAAESNSSSMTSCSPAAAALQKLFNCSSTAHSCRSINNFRISPNNNNNCHSNSHISQHHGSSNDPQHHHYANKETGKQPHSVHQTHLENQMPLSLGGNSNSNSTTSGTSCVLPCVGGNKKKHFNTTTSVKSTLIAKKTKFWKYLVEEEKWRKHSDENLSTTTRDPERFFGKHPLSNSLNLNESQTSNTAQNDGRNSQTITNHSSKSNLRNCNSDTNKNSNINQKSSAELYKEAAQLLGLSCTLCDNCRCLDCQSRYFECDDSDTYSEFSFMDEYFENPPPDVEGNFHHLSSPSLHQQQSQEEDASVSEDQPTSADFENNVLDHYESLNDLTLGGTRTN